MALAIGVPSLAGASPTTNPKPTEPAAAGSASTPTTVAQVQAELAKLGVQNDQLVEQYNQSAIDLAAKQEAASVAEDVASQAADAYQVGRQQMSAALTAQYESGSFSSAGALLSSQSGQSYLDHLATLSMISDRLGQEVAALHQAQVTAQTAEQQAQLLVAAATAKRTALTAQKAQVNVQITRYSTLFATLTAAQRAAVLAQTSPVATAAQITATEAAVEAAMAQEGSTPAMKAVNFALHQLGKWYVWGAAGPTTYDCSGLTMRAWEAAGVSLPHSAADQYNYGTHVPATVAALKPGDLIFFYEPIGHVTIYLGNGMMVSAPETGEQVSIVPLSAFSSSIVGATRLS